MTNTIFGPVDQDTGLSSMVDLVATPSADPPSTRINREQVRSEPVGWLKAVPTSAADRNHPAAWYQQALAVDSATSATHVARLATKNLSARERAETRILTRHPLDGMDTAGLALVAHPELKYAWATPTWSVLVKAGDRVVTHAGIVYRV